MGQADLDFPPSLTPNVFQPENYGGTTGPAVSRAYSALVAAGGGILKLTPDTTYTNVMLPLTSSVPTLIKGSGAIITPQPSSYALIFNAGRSQNQLIGVEECSIVCTGVSGGSGIEIVDHYGAYLDRLRIIDPSTGLLITDATGWSESSMLDDVYIKNPSAFGIDFETEGGTGSFGYADWGLVHVDNIPGGAVGIRWGTSTGFSHSTIARLILHSSAANAIGMQVAGDAGYNTSINAVIESLAAMAGSIALDYNGSGSLDGCDLNLAIIGSGWGTTLNNPSNRPLQLRAPRNFKSGGGATAATSIVEQSGAFGDANPMFSRAEDGTMRWGVGGSTAQDTTLQRSGSGFLSTPGAYQVGGNLTSVGGLRVLTNTSNTSGTLSTSSSCGQQVDTTSAPVVKTMYNTGTLGYMYIFIKQDGSANTLSIAPPASGTINGSASSIVLSTQGAMCMMFSTATPGAWIAKVL